MPYKDVTDLPQAVRESLPRHGQEIYKEAFNSAWNQYGQDEIRASKVAWSAVGKKFKKTNKGWVEAMQTQNTEMKKTMKKQQPKEKVGKVMPMVEEAVLKPAAKKPAAKKPAAKKPAAKKPAAKKPAAKKPAKKKVAKKATAKKSVAKKSAVKKPAKRKTAAKKSTAKKSVMKKTKRSAPKRAAAKKRK